MADGHVRHPEDFYATPPWVVDAILPHLPDGVACDPCAGDGAIVAAIVGAGRHCYGIEISAERVVDARAKRGVTLTHGDGLTGHERFKDPLIVMNPPYKAAEEWVRAMVQPGRTVAALLRLGFLASASRKALFAEAGMPDVYVLSKRPSFTGGGTDSADYAWMVWGPGRVGRVQRLEVP